MRSLRVSEWEKWDAEIDEYLRACVRIDPLLIEDEYKRVSSDMAYWSHRCAELHKTYQLAKLRRDQARGESYRHWRRALVKRYGKATAKDIEAEQDNDLDVLEAEASVIEGEYNRDRAKGVLESIRAKRDMLISLGAHRRVEMQGNPLIRDQARTRRMMQEGDDAEEW